MRISFTQFLKPDGRQVTTDIDRPEGVVQKARRLNCAGYVFEIEVLNTGEISMEVVNSKNTDEILAGEICANGPDVPVCVDRMIDNAFAKLEKMKKKH